MRIEAIEVCGFRGFRDKTQIECGLGFTVISGRNGAGKSTLCDAVEFAVTGSIDKYAVEKAGQEDLRDYIWWRGAGSPEAQYVVATFVSEGGDRFTVTRTRESGCDRSQEEIQAALCKGSAPEDALKQLVRTTIIRDEWIASLSLDLKETERFEFVRGALGDAEGMGHSNKAKEVVKAVERANSKYETEYETAHSKLSDLIAQQSEARAGIARAGDIESALQSVALFVPEATTEVTIALSDGRRVLVEGRIGLGRKGEGLKLARELGQLKEQYSAPEASRSREMAMQELAEGEKRKSEADAALGVAADDVVAAEEADRTAASLALVLEHGEHLGLHGSQCPLCAAIRSPEEFRAGLEMARRRAAALSSGVQEARGRWAAMQREVDRATKELEAAEAAMAIFREQERGIIKREEALSQFCEEAGLDLLDVEDLAVLEEDMDRERDRLIDLERALVVLESSQIVLRVSLLERNIAELRQEADRGAESVSRSRLALAVAHDMERSVRRVGAEITDERLAEISPLLNELYQRLRPHTDWRTIHYRIRGEIRKFLSLRVGDGLNPQFVFSSGQRRATGLAFLLSVHLARAWTDLRVLILDDPVQHIDDYRSLQLVEVLAALRLEGRQVICAVEDSALADLLCRRLVSSLSEVGRRVDIGVGSNGRIGILRNVEIPPMPVEVLRRVEGVQGV